MIFHESSQSCAYAYYNQSYAYITFLHYVDSKVVTVRSTTVNISLF